MEAAAEAAEARARSAVACCCICCCLLFLIISSGVGIGFGFGCGFTFPWDPKIADTDICPTAVRSGMCRLYDYSDERCCRSDGDSDGKCLNLRIGDPCHGLDHDDQCGWATIDGVEKAHLQRHESASVGQSTRRASRVAETRATTRSARRVAAETARSTPRSAARIRT